MTAEHANSAPGDTRHTDHGGDPDGDRGFAVELLGFSMDPRHVEEFIAADHDIWTLGLATSSDGTCPVVSKEIWLDDANPGTVHVVITWTSRTAWKSIPQRRLTELENRFTEAFPHPHRLTHEQTITGSRLRRHRRWCPDETP
jgi:uncharacterized protein (TIGR03792 family)